MTTLTPHQTEAYDKIMKWAADPCAPWRFKLGGYAGCLSGDTVIRVNRRRHTREFTLEKAYLKWNRIPSKILHGGFWRRDGYTKFLCDTGSKIDFHTPQGILYSGKKALYKVEDSRGHMIKATLDHKFLTENGYVELRSLKKGATVFVVRYRKPRGVKKHKKRRVIESLKYHPMAKVQNRRVKSAPHRNSSWEKVYKYQRVNYSRLVVEADMNDVSVEEYIEVLKKDELKARTMCTLPSHMEVHHRNGDAQDDHLDNLQVLSKEDHTALHCAQSNMQNQYNVKEQATIISIEYIGVEDTYDIVMHDPHRNFVANNFIVHNSGKTTLVQRLVSNLDSEPLLCAPTGKAASVVSKKLPGSSVSTVHGLLYRPLGDNSENISGLKSELKFVELELKLSPPTRELKLRRSKIRKELFRLQESGLQFAFNLEDGHYDGHLIICDEASMVTPKMAADFEKTGAKVLFVGDPAQLPPVKAGLWFRKADTTLTEIHRQAMDNPIVRMAWKVRSQQTCQVDEFHDGKRVFIVRDNVDPTEILADDEIDQIITHQVITYRMINLKMREKLGYEGRYPLTGEKLICRMNDRKQGFVNGIQATATRDTRGGRQALRMAVDYDDGVLYDDLPVYSRHFDLHYNPDAPELDWSVRRKSKMVEFDWAYALTVHRSQGSEWPTVALVEDRAGMDPKLLYTAITRASERFVLLKTSSHYMAAWKQHIREQKAMAR